MEVRKEGVRGLKESAHRKVPVLHKSRPEGKEVLNLPLKQIPVRSSEMKRTQSCKWHNVRIWKASLPDRCCVHGVLHVHDGEKPESGPVSETMQATEEQGVAAAGVLGLLVLLS